MSCAEPQASSGPVSLKMEHSISCRITGSGETVLVHRHDIILAVNKFSERVNFSALSKATGPFKSAQICSLQMENVTLLNKFWGGYISLNTKNIFSLISKDLVTI